MAYSDLTTIPGIESSIVKIFAKIEINSIDDLKQQNPEHLYRFLKKVNLSENKPTEINFLYVIRMAVYYAHGGRDQEKLFWNFWKDPNKALTS